MLDNSFSAICFDKTTTTKRNDEKKKWLKIVSSLECMLYESSFSLRISLLLDDFSEEALFWVASLCVCVYACVGVWCKALWRKIIAQGQWNEKKKKFLGQNHEMGYVCRYCTCFLMMMKILLCEQFQQLWNKHTAKQNINTFWKSFANKEKLNSTCQHAAWITKAFANNIKKRKTERAGEWEKESEREILLCQF